jgi:type II secretory pathway pseudopilin PulG
MKKKGFTLIEIVVWMVLIGVWLTAIMGVLQYATKVNNTIKSQVIATNLAREWIETIFSIRDTNWKIFSSKKDQCWLAVFPVWATTQCEQLTWINPINGQYFELWENLVWNTYYGLTFTWEKVLKNTAWNQLLVRDNNKENANDQWFRMCFKDNTWKMCNDMQDQMWSWNESRFQTKYGRFRRAIIVKWLFLKDNNPWWTEMECAHGNDTDTNTSLPCGGSEPKELRFCSRVDYAFGPTRRVELCSALTNFLE